MPFPFATLMGGALPLPFMSQQQQSQEASLTSEEGRGLQQQQQSSAASDHAHASNSNSSHPFPQFFLPPVATSAAAADQTPSLSLVTSGTRLYGSPNRMDPRTFLGIKIYDFAVYADLEQLRKVNAVHHQPPPLQQQPQQQPSNEVTAHEGCAKHGAHRAPAWLAAPRSAFQGISSACSWLGSTVLDGWGFDSSTNMDSSETGPDSSLQGMAGSVGPGSSRRERRLHKQRQRQQQRQERRQQRESWRCERRSARALRRKCGGKAGSEGGEDLGEHAVAVLKRSPSVPVSIVLRAARDLPVALLQAEMGRVLQNRIVKAGGDEDAAELPLLLECFSSHRLPRECCGSSSKHSNKHSSSSSASAEGEALSSEAHTASHSKSRASGSEVVVKQGSVLVFTRDAQGCLSATALTHACSPAAAAAAAEGGMLGMQGSECAGVGGRLIGGSADSSANNNSGESGSISSSGSGGGGFEMGGSGLNGGVLARMPMGGAAWGEGSEGVGLLEEPLRCAPLCAALLDVYLGSPPVCRKAKASAEAFLAHTISSPPPKSGRQSSRVNDKGSSESKASSSSSAIEPPLPACA